MNEFKIGDVVFVRSNTRDDYIGRVAGISALFIVLDQCSWIGDSGRFGRFMRGTPGDGLETEYLGDGWKTTFSAGKKWPGQLPTEDSHP